MVDFDDLIGMPFEYGGRGPERFDCYGLVMECARRDGITLPDFGFANRQALVHAMMGATMPQWIDVRRQPGAVVLIRVGRFVSHVGYMVNDHQMIHAWEKSNGVTIVNVDTWKHRIVGFYKHVAS